MIQINRPATSAHLDSDTELELVMIPHRAMDWRGNKRIIAILGSVCILIALGYGLVLGTWIILPFAGLEVIALAAGLYYASWKLNYRHVIRITDNEVIVEKGVYKPRKRWRLSRLATHLYVEAPQHDWEAKTLRLKARDTEISIGSFLGKEDVLKVIEVLTPLVTQTVFLPSRYSN